jgi:hypothetical protein
MSRLQQALIAVLVAQLLLIAWVFWPRPAPASGGGAPLLGELKPADVAEFTITDDQGATVKVARLQDAWVLPEAGSFPVLDAKVTSLLSKLAGLRALQPVTQTSSSHEQLKVGDNAFLRRIQLQMASGTTTTLYVGSPAGGSGSHVRLANHDEVYLGEDLSVSDLGASPASWVEPLYFSLRPEDVTALTLKNDNGEWAFAKDSQGSWSVKDPVVGETLDPNKVTELVRQLSAIYLTKPLGKSDDPAYGLAQPAVTVLVRTQAEGQSKEHILTFGAKDPGDASVVLKSSDSPYYVRSAAYLADDLASMTRASFLQPPPTPAVGQQMAPETPALPVQ